MPGSSVVRSLCEAESARILFYPENDGEVYSICTSSKNGDSILFLGELYFNDANEEVLAIFTQDIAEFGDSGNEDKKSGASLLDILSIDQERSELVLDESRDSIGDDVAFIDRMTINDKSGQAICIFRSRNSEGRPIYRMSGSQ